MVRFASWPIATLVAAASAGLAGCDGRGGSFADGVAAVDDAAFAAMQERGRQAMGVDQHTSTHVFDALPDGGRIELQRDVDDAHGVERIRQHLQAIVRAFGGGDFGTPAFVHIESVPGASVMAEKRDAITYTYGALPRGGEVRITTEDPGAIEAIHEFLAFQREAHRAGGRASDHHGAGTAHPPHGPGHQR
ncbi:MAG: hypothetical protein ACREM1_24150 [Longimicrobiales bacterium]